MIKCDRLPDDIKHEIESYILYKKCVICGTKGVCYKPYYTCNFSCSIKSLLVMVFSSILFIFYCITHTILFFLLTLCSIVISMLYIIVSILHVVVSVYVHFYIMVLLIERIYKSALT